MGRGADCVPKMAVFSGGVSDQRDFLFLVPASGTQASTPVPAANLPSVAVKVGPHRAGVGAASLPGSDGKNLEIRDTLSKNVAQE